MSKLPCPMLAETASAVESTDPRSALSTASRASPPCGTQPQ
ncbi:hypothetical protein [Lentzea sp. NPDC092896]